MPERTQTAKSKSKTRRRRRTMADDADRYRLYELSVQDPATDCESFDFFYKEANGKLPRVLREDFCAAAAICLEWVSRRPDARAIGVDIDPEPLERGEQAKLDLPESARSRVTLVRGDVRKARDKADVIGAGNFSFFLWKTRAELLAYFRSVRACLNKGGIFVMDMMGGGALHDENVEESRAVARPTKRDKELNPPFRYVWEQERFDPITHDTRFHIHFRFKDGSALERAFTYDWRLWTLPEVRELLDEAGFSKVHVYWPVDEDEDDSGDVERRTSAEAMPAFVCYVVAER